MDRVLLALLAALPAGAVLAQDKPQPPAAPEAATAVHAFEYAGQRWFQADINGQLAQMGLPYRIYQLAEDGPYTAFKKGPEGLEPLKTRTPRSSVGKRDPSFPGDLVSGESRPALCCGPKANGDDYAPGELELSGSLLIWHAPGNPNARFFDVKDPFSEIGGEAYRVLRFRSKTRLGDLLELLGYGPSQAEVLAAMDRKIKALGGGFDQIKVLRSDEGDDFFVRTTAEADFDQGGFWRRRVPGAEPPQPAQADAADLFPEQLGDGSIQARRLRVDADEGYALYQGDDGLCVVRWNVLDSAGRATPRAVSFVVAGGGIPGGADVCGQADQWDVRSLRLNADIDPARLAAGWNGGKFSVWARVVEEGKEGAAFLADLIVGSGS